MFENARNKYVQKNLKRTPDSFASSTFIRIQSRAKVI